MSLCKNFRLVRADLFGLDMVSACGVQSHAVISSVLLSHTSCC